MTRFSFRLERVLRVRAIEEAAAKADWAAAVYAVHNAEEAEQRAREQVATAESDLALRLGSGRVDARSVMASQHLLDGLRRRAVEAGAAIGALRAEAEERRATWAAARREKRALERLRERALTRHRTDVERREANERDELAGARLSRDSSQAGAVAENPSMEGPRPLLSEPRTHPPR